MKADRLEAAAASAAKESLRKAFVSSLSLSTFLVQLMGYLPFSFDKPRNSLRLKLFSFPTLSLAFHVWFSVTWVAFYLLHAEDFAKIIAAKSGKGSSSTLQLTYMGNVFLATISPFAIRICCLSNHKEIIGFYESLTQTVSSLVFKSISRNVGVDYLRWMKEINGEMKSVWMSKGVALIFHAYRVTIIFYSLHFSPVDREYTTFVWKWFGGVSVVVSAGISVLLSAMLIWLSKVVGLIRLGFKALEEQFEVSDPQLWSWNCKLVKEKVNCEVCTVQKERVGFQNSPEYFMIKFAELKELVHRVNSIFAIPILVSLGGVVGSGIAYEFMWLTVWEAYERIPLFAFVTSSSLMISMIFLYSANFWSFCNASQKLGEQATQCLNQLMKLDWDAYSLGSQHKMQIFYQQNLHSPTFISPGNYFKVSRKTLTSVLAVLITYVIVLLQFKSSE